MDLSFLHGSNFHRVEISYGFKSQGSASRVPNVMYQGWDGFLSLRILMGEVINGNLAFRELVVYGKDLKLGLKMVISVPFLHLKLKSKDVACGPVVP